jgi:hypothetical protein
MRTGEEASAPACLRPAQYQHFSCLKARSTHSQAPDPPPDHSVHHLQIGLPTPLCVTRRVADLVSGPGLLATNSTNARHHPHVLSGHSRAANRRRSYDNPNRLCFQAAAPCAGPGASSRWPPQTFRKRGHAKPGGTEGAPPHEGAFSGPGLSARLVRELLTPSRQRLAAKCSVFRPAISLGVRGRSSRAWPRSCGGRGAAGRCGLPLAARGHAGRASARPPRLKAPVLVCGRRKRRVQTHLAFGRGSSAWQAPVSRARGRRGRRWSCTVLWPPRLPPRFRLLVRAGGQRTALFLRPRRGMPPCGRRDKTAHSPTVPRSSGRVFRGPRARDLAGSCNGFCRAPSRRRSPPAAPRPPRGVCAHPTSG